MSLLANLRECRPTAVGVQWSYGAYECTKQVCVGHVVWVHHLSPIEQVVLERERKRERVSQNKSYS